LPADAGIVFMGMREIPKVLGAVAFIALSGLACSNPQPNAVEGADLVFRSGAVYTVDEEHPWAEAVANTAASRPTMEISQVPVLRTLLDGKIVYRRSRSQP
jgi:hypothetical protein